jgi:hypothetical protein
MSSGYSGNSAPRTKAQDHSKVAHTHKPSGKPSPIMPTGQKSPAGSDAYSKKKYGPSSHNNGMTN